MKGKTTTTGVAEIIMNAPKYLNDGDRWMLAEDIPDIDFQFSQIWISSFVNDLERTIGVNYKKVLSVYDGYALKFYYGHDDSEAVSRRILTKILTEGFGPEINGNIRRAADELFIATQRIDADALGLMNGDELSGFYASLDDVHTRFYSWCWLPNAADMFHAHLTEHLRSILRNRTHSEEEVNQALVALSFFEQKSFVQEELESLLDVAATKKLGPAYDAEFERKLEVHHAAYFYLKHLWIGKDGISTIDDYRHAIDELLSEGDPTVMLGHEQAKWSDDVRERDACEARLRLTKEERGLFRTYAEFAFTKAYRRRIQIFWAYRMDTLFSELARRFDMPFKDTRFLLPEEVGASLTAGMSEGMREIAAERARHCVYYAEKGLDVVVTGTACDAFESMLPQEADMELSELRGQVACTGKVEGVVKIVNSVSDMQKVCEGDILVSIATNPDIVPAMKKAAAFVTEQGGVTSHAAIVAREMRKPCIIGTKVATKALKDGDVVMVDAHAGVVRIIRR